MKESDKNRPKRGRRERSPSLRDVIVELRANREETLSVKNSITDLQDSLLASISSFARKKAPVAPAASQQESRSSSTTPTTTATTAKLSPAPLPAKPAPLPQQNLSIDNRLDISSLLGERIQKGEKTLSTFSRMRADLIKRIRANLPTKFNFDRTVSIASILGERKQEKESMLSGFNRMRADLIKNLRSGLPKRFNFDRTVSIASILGERKHEGPFFLSSFNRMRSALIGNIRKALPTEFKFDNLSLGDIMGETKETGLFFRMRLTKLRHDILGMLRKTIKAQLEGDDPNVASSSDDSTRVVNAIEHGFEETHTLLKRAIEFLKGDDLNEREEAKKKRMKYERLFGGKGAGVDKSSAHADDGGGKSGLVAGKMGGAGAAMFGIGVGKAIYATFSAIALGLLKLSPPILLKGVLTLTALGGAIGVHAWAFKQFADDINWKNVFIGVGAMAAFAGVAALLGKVSPLLILGSIGVGALGLALIPFTSALSNFADLKWKDVFIGLGAMAAFGAVAAILGIASPFILGTATALGALGLTLPLFAKALTSFTPVMKAFAQSFQVVGEGIARIAEGIGSAISGVANTIFSGMKRVFDSVSGIFDSIRGMIRELVVSISELTNLDEDRMISSSKGIRAIGSAIASFGTNAGLSAILGFFSSDPVKRFERFAEAGPGLQITAAAIAELGKSIEYFNLDSINDLGKGFDTIGSSLDQFMERGLFRRRDPLKPLRDIAELMPKFDFSQGSGNFSDSMEGLFKILSNQDSLQFLATHINIVSSAFTKLSSAVDNLDKAKLKTALEMIKGSYQDNVVPSQVKNPAEKLIAGYIENSELHSQKEAAQLAMPLTTLVDNSSGPSSNSISNTTYHVPNYIDDTLQNIVYVNRF